MNAVRLGNQKSTDPMLGTQLSGRALAWHMKTRMQSSKVSKKKKKSFHKVNKNHLSQTDRVHLSILKANITDSPKSQPKAKVISPKARRRALDTVILKVLYQIHSLLWPARPATASQTFFPAQDSPEPSTGPCGAHANVGETQSARRCPRGTPHKGLHRPAAPRRVGVLSQARPGRPRSGPRAREISAEPRLCRHVPALATEVM